MNTETFRDAPKDLEAISIGDYFAILNRRKAAFFIPFILVLTAAILIAYILPPIYKSEATILIEKQEIPADLVETTVTGYVQEHIEGISKRLLTHDNLWTIAERLNLYPEERNAVNRHDIVVKMKDSIAVAMVDVKTTEPGSGRQGVATIAFTVAFEADSPEVAREVTNELASLYIAENQRARSAQATDVSEFLNQEAESLNQDITDLEKKLAAFKQSEQSQLPELRSLNLQLFEKTDVEIERTREEIRSLEDRRTALQAELAITKPNAAIVNEGGARILTGSERLSVLTAEYLRLSSRYSSKHPDLVKLQREIESLGGENDTSGAVELVNRLAILKDRLVEAKRKYSSDHPDVKTLEQSVAAVERGLYNSTLSNVGQSNNRAVAPDNPRYVSLQTQLDATNSNLTSEKANLVKLQEKLNEYEQRLFRTPEVERDYRLLSRDYENTKKKYQEIRDKQLEAKLAIKLESGSKGQRFAIVQPAFLPTTPESPNRLGIGLLGFLLAFSLGIACVTVMEYLDRTIYNSKDLISVFRAPPLVTIPFIPGSDERAKEPLHALASNIVAMAFVLHVVFAAIVEWQLPSA